MTKIIQHCSVVGRTETVVRTYQVHPVERYAQYERSVCVSFVEPRCRRRRCFRVLQNDITYFTVEQNGRVVYDSRSDVPCDMEEWRATDARHPKIDPAKYHVWC